MIEYGEHVFDDTSMFGDNTDRVNDVMALPSIGVTPIVRYKVPIGKNSSVQAMALSCDFKGRLLSGAYTAAQAGARVQIRFNNVARFEQKFNWTGLSGYIGGADDYNAENEIMLTGHDTPAEAGTVIDLLITGETVVRRMIYVELYGTLDDGTEIRADNRVAVDGTAATPVPVYTVPVDRVLRVKQLVITTRHIDIYAGKGYFMYNGLPVMTFDVAQTEIGGVYGLVFPFYDLPLAESASIGFRLDNYECGTETIAASVYSNEESALPTPAEIAEAVWARAGRTLS